MRKDGSLEKLRRKLLLQGLPRGYVNRTVREFAEHRDDLETQARAEGLSEDTARIAAEQSLGDTEALAEAILKTNQRRYWWGRHPVVSFGLLPIPLIVCLFLGSVVLMFKATGLFDWSEHKGALPEPNWTVISFWYYSTGYVASALVAALFCWLARRSHCRFKWAGITCGLLSLHGLMFGSGMTIPYATDNGAFWVGYYSKSLDLLGMVTPLSVLFIFFLVSVREFNSYGVDHQKEVA